MEFIHVVDLCFTQFPNTCMMVPKMSGQRVAFGEALGAERACGAQVGQNLLVLQQSRDVIVHHCLFEDILELSICLEI